MIRNLLLGALMVISTHTSACPNTGKVVITDVQGGEGFFLIGHYGADSYSAYLHGKQYQPIEGVAGRVMFRIDDVAYQQFVVDRSDYSEQQRPHSDAEDLEAHFQWELAHIREQAERVNADFQGYNSYGVVETKTFDGTKRKFFIWEIQMAGAKQYFVTTTSSKGVILLSAIGVRPDQEEAVKAVIDNYMYRFERLTTGECPGA